MSVWKGFYRGELQFCMMSTLSDCSLEVFVAAIFCKQNHLKDRSVIQLYSKHTQVYLALADGGGVVGMTDSNHKNSESVLCVKYVGGIIIRTKVYTVYYIQNLLYL